MVELLVGQARVNRQADVALADARGVGEPRLPLGAVRSAGVITHGIRTLPTPATVGERVPYRFLVAELGVYLPCQRYRIVGPHHRFELVPVYPVREVGDVLVIPRRTEGSNRTHAFNAGQRTVVELGDSPPLFKNALGLAICDYSRGGEQLLMIMLARTIGVLNNPFGDALLLAVVFLILLTTITQPIFLRYYYDHLAE